MSKKLYVILSVCLVLITVTGCAKHITRSAQSTDEFTVSSTLTQSIVDAITGSSTSTRLTNGTSTALPKPTQSKTTTNSEGDKDMNKNCKLIVNGKDITSGNYVKLNYEYHYAELPLTLVMKALGAKVEWQSNTTAMITFGGKDYILDTTKDSLIEVN